MTLAEPTASAGRLLVWSAALAVLPACAATPADGAVCRKSPELPIARVVPPQRDSAFNRALSADIDEGASHASSPPDWAEESILAYPERFSVTEGAPLMLRYAAGATSRGNQLLGISIEDALDRRVVVRRVWRSIDRRPLVRSPCRSFLRGGCAFPARLVLRERLDPGVYTVELLGAEGERSAPVYFNVRSRNSASREPIVVMFPTFTWHAYNAFGGGSLYSVREPYGVESTRPSDTLLAASLDRPLLVSHDRAYEHHGPEATLPVLRVLKSKHIPFRAVSNGDLERDADALAGSRVLVLAGHDEYWTAKMRARIDQFIKEGGSVANFSGNVAWWRTALVDRTLYKDSRQRDRGCPRAPSWMRDVGLANRRGDPPQRTFGVSYEFAGYPVRRMLTEQEALDSGLSAADYQATDGITVVNERHPVFSGTGLSHHSTWGASVGVLGVELDGVPLAEETDLPRQGLPAFPAELMVLASATAFNKNGYWRDGKLQRGLTRVGIFTESRPCRPAGGRVISFGSIRFTRALHVRDRTAQALFLNSVGYLLNAEN